MSVGKSILNVKTTYNYYCEQKKELEALRREISGYLSEVCCYFKCSSCPLFNMCEKTGGFKELDE